MGQTERATVLDAPARKGPASTRLVVPLPNWADPFQVRSKEKVTDIDRTSVFERF